MAGRRVRKLAEHIGKLIDKDATILDVRCSDGKFDDLILRPRPDVTITGIDTLVREQARIPVEGFDGHSIPREDKSVDEVLFVDVLHHTDDPMILLRKATRVARQAILTKDHDLRGFLAGPTLRFMDRVSNSRYGVHLPYNCWPRERWLDAFNRLDWRVESWTGEQNLYPFPASLLFGRSLHFIAKLVPSSEVPSPGLTRGIEA